jgi:hypothetical protein
MFGKGSARADSDDHVVVKRGLTAYNVFILVFVGLGSMSYGYAASIIGTTLGMSGQNL